MLNIPLDAKNSYLSLWGLGSLHLSATVVEGSVSFRGAKVKRGKVEVVAEEKEKLRGIVRE